MVIQRISTATPIFKAVVPEELTPKKLCETCKRWYEKQCKFFNRRTEAYYNRCFNHSDYNNDLSKVYVSPPKEVLDRWAEEAEKRARGEK